MKFELEIIKNRPQTIIWFDWLFWSAIFASYLGESFLGYKTLDFLWIEIFVLGIMGLIWYFIARRENNIFKWIYAVLAFVGIGLYGWGVIASAFEFELVDDAQLSMSVPELVLGGVVNLLSVGAATCLFLKPSHIWFKSDGRIFENDDQLSDIFE